MDNRYIYRETTFHIYPRKEYINLDEAKIASVRKTSADKESLNFYKNLRDSNPGVHNHGKKANNPANRNSDNKVPFSQIGQNLLNAAYKVQNFGNPNINRDDLGPNNDYLPIDRKNPNKGVTKQNTDSFGRQNTNSFGELNKLTDTAELNADPQLIISGCGHKEIQIMQFDFISNNQVRDKRQIHEDGIFCITTYNNSLFTSCMKGVLKEFDVLTDDLIYDYGKVCCERISGIYCSNKIMIIADYSGSVKQICLSYKNVVKEYKKLHEYKIVTTAGYKDYFFTGDEYCIIKKICMSQRKVQAVYDDFLNHEIKKIQINDKFFIANDNFGDFCIVNYTTEIKWKKYQDIPVKSVYIFEVCQDNLFIGEVSGNLKQYSLSKKTLTKRWGFVCHGSRVEHILCYKNNLYVGDSDGMLLSFDIYSGIKQNDFGILMSNIFCMTMFTGQILLELDSKYQTQACFQKSENLFYKHSGGLEDTLKVLDYAESVNNPMNRTNMSFGGFYKN